MLVWDGGFIPSVRPVANPTPILFHQYNPFGGLQTVTIHSTDIHQYRCSQRSYSPTVFRTSETTQKNLAIRLTLGHKDHNCRISKQHKLVWYGLDGTFMDQFQREKEVERESGAREKNERLDYESSTLYLAWQRVFIVYKEKRPVWAAEQAYSG